MRKICPWGSAIDGVKRAVWLKDRGLFDQFKEIKDGFSEGTKPIIADKLATEEIMRIYEDSQNPQEKKPVVEKKSRKKTVKKDEDFNNTKLTKDHCAWIIAHYDRKEHAGLTISDAPTAVAWSILVQSREDPKTFQAILERVAPPKNTAVEKVSDEENLNLTGMAEAIRQEFGAYLEEATPILRRVAPSIF